KNSSSNSPTRLQLIDARKKNRSGRPRRLRLVKVRSADDANAKKRNVSAKNAKRVRIKNASNTKSSNGWRFKQKNWKIDWNGWPSVCHQRLLILKRLECSNTPG